MRARNHLKIDLQRIKPHNPPLASKGPLICAPIKAAELVGKERSNVTRLILAVDLAHA